VHISRGGAAGRGSLACGQHFIAAVRSAPRQTQRRLSHRRNSGYDERVGLKTESPLQNVNSVVYRIGNSGLRANHWGKFSLSCPHPALNIIGGGSCDGGVRHEGSDSEEEEEMCFVCRN
jgi:hypothetical protein